MNKQQDILDQLQQLPGLPHVYLYPSGKNVYPWLADAQALITDYSSIAYDFLLTNKPIIYYQYDIEKYRELRGETLVDDQDFIAGSLVNNQAELQVELVKRLAERPALQHQKRHYLVVKMNVNTKLTVPAIVRYVRR